jgi:glyoxylase-like metal-dependent hydrolase (beta-lactamase superfamily II)
MSTAAPSSSEGPPGFAAEPQQIAADVWRLPLPLPDNPLHAVNVYALLDPSGVTLIDAGWSAPETGQALAAGLVAIGADLADVHTILATHVHDDHYAQAVLLRRRFGSRVTVHLGAGERESIEFVATTDDAGNGAFLRSVTRLGAGAPAELLRQQAFNENFDASLWTHPDVYLEGGATITRGPHRLRAVATPGHTRGHLVYLDAERHLVYAGDHVLPRITPSIGYEMPMPSNPLGAFLASLSLMLDQPDGTLLPAHGSVHAATHPRVRELITHHRRRLDECVAIIDTQARSPFELAHELTWTRRRSRLDELDPFNQVMATLETRHHLELLVSAGRARRVESADAVAYRAAAG